MADKLCVIAGVGSGMGQAIARAFAEEGYNLAMISRNPENMEPYKKEVENIGRRADLFQSDVTNHRKMLGTFEDIISQLGVPDVAVYNVATMTMEKPSELTPKAIIDTLPVNFFGALNTATAVLPAMRDSGSGVLLFTGGGFAIEPSVERTTHSVGKAALRNWVYALHQELAPEGVHAATVTITRPIDPGSGSTYDPDTIASQYIKLVNQELPNWDWEIIHKNL